MKYVLLFLAAIFTFSNGHCSEELRSDPCEKTYIQPNQISISEGGIFVYVDNTWLAAEAIHADASGIYVSDLVDNHGWTQWKCRYSDCNYINPWYVNECQGCGRR